MNKILLLALMVFGTLSIQAQSANGTVERLQAKEMEALEKIVTYSNENVAFNKNQKVKLERIFLDKAKEIVSLREKDITKGEYFSAYNKLMDKYNPKVEALLTTEQRVEYRRNKTKQIKIAKD